MLDDDDEYLYGSSATAPETKAVSPPVVTPVPESAKLDKIHLSPNGVVALLESEAENTVPGLSDVAHEGMEEEEEEVELGEESEEEEEEIEFIMEPPNRSLDFRNQNVRQRTMSSTTTTTAPSPAKMTTAQIQPSLTTEYTPMPRGVIPTAPQAHVAPPSVPGQQPAPQPQQVQLPESGQQQVDGVDTSMLPPATAPPSHPVIDPTAPGMLDGRSIFEVDMAAMTEKPWRRPGSDISDWFNYGFDELSWEAYCYRRRELGEMANVLKANLINFTGMPEDQLSTLPQEVRQMVMTGMTALMNAGGPGPGMMGPGVMMDMSSMMGPMGMGMGMNGDMAMGNAMMQMQDGAQQGVNVGVGGTGAPEQVGSAVGMMQDGFSGAPGPGGMMNMGMAGDFGMQDQTGMGQQMYQNMEVPTNVTPVPAPGPGPSVRGGTPVAPAPYRARGMPGTSRGRPFPMRGRGRGLYGGDGGPPVPIRPASPLPPGVPTGPRNQNKYKDRDGNAPAVEGLDYGGGGGGGREGGRTPSGEPEDRNRKRRSSPGLDDIRGSKRR
ncbi:hypothetical protein AX17_000265 [Amanita inopinata Kibby_2008]|nr:hypothetical protein AX17_000265 [Amanita inopinata Kibby_2008]